MCPFLPYSQAMRHALSYPSSCHVPCPKALSSGSCALPFPALKLCVVSYPFSGHVPCPKALCPALGPCALLCPQTL